MFIQNNTGYQDKKITQLETLFVGSHCHWQSWWVHVYRTRYRATQTIRKKITQLYNGPVCHCCTAWSKTQIVAENNCHNMARRYWYWRKSWLFTCS